MGEIRIHIKQFVTVNKQTGQQGYYAGSNPATLSFVTGILPAARQWGNYGSYIDATQYVSDPNKLKLTWTLEIDEFGNVVSDGGIASKKAASGSLTFEGVGFALLKAWLLDDISAPFNLVQVMIEDVGCGRYMDFSISPNEIIYCENEICTFEVSFKQIEDPWSCIQRTVISDNWQGWFQPIPTSGKKHPRFSYCNERRPNGLLIVEWVLLSLLGTIMLLLVPLFAVIAVVIIVINVIITVINAIISFINALGADINEINKIATFSPLDPLEGVANMFIESCGCGREHPAPLVRDYISNVCSKCGITVNTQSAPVFYNSRLTFNTNSRGYVDGNNPHYNACYAYINKQRGIRRFKNLSFTGNSIPADEYYINTDAAPIDSLDMFLDKLKTLYNFEWYIENVNNSGSQQPTLYIQRKDQFKNPGTVVFDVSPSGPDRPRVVEGICFEWNGAKNNPAFIKGLYSEDAADTCGNEANRYYNNNQSAGNVDIQPNYKGNLDKTQQFGAARFRLDGVSGDYVYNAFQVVANVSFFTLFLNSVVLALVRDQLLLYADYAILLKDETATLPKILLWDGQSFENAKCIRPYFVTPNNGATPNKNINYNPTGVEWSIKHRFTTYVQGNNGALANPTAQPYGTYRVKDLFGIITILRPAMLPNYYMTFDSEYQDSMWDYFHYIDDPKYNPILNQNFRFKFEKCCDILNRLGVFDTSGNSALGKKIKISNGFYPEGKITSIEVSNDPSDIDGQFVEIKGLR